MLFNSETEELHAEVFVNINYLYLFLLEFGNSSGCTISKNFFKYQMSERSVFLCMI